MENKTCCGKDVLLSYVGMDMGYNEGKLMYIAGKEDAELGDVGTLDRPVLGVTIDPTEPDPVLFSYVYVKGERKYLRQLLVKLKTLPLPAEPARFSVLLPSADCCGDEWVPMTVDVTLIDDSGTVVSFNPHALAQYGNFLYLVDDQTQKIVMVKAEDLETAADEAQIEVYTFDLSEDLKPVITYAGRGQAAIILEQNLYALYIDANDAATQFADSYLFRLSIDGSTGELNLNAQTVVGINAQSIIPVNNGTAVQQLLIPAVGGAQSLSGVTNGVNSNISYVGATDATWPASAPVVVTGDLAPTPPAPATAYDIHAVAAAMRNGSSAVFILTQIYTTDGQVALWRLYRTSVKDFLSIKGEPTLSEAVTAGNLTVVDEGTLTSINGWGTAFGLYFWDLLYEQVPGSDDDEGDRLWAALGTPILVTSGAYENGIGDPAYGSPTSVVQNAFIEYGYLGGDNINMGAFDLLIETQNQAKRGVSLKRTIRKAQAPRPTEEQIAAAKAKAAQAKGGKGK